MNTLILTLILTLPATADEVVLVSSDDYTTLEQLEFPVFDEDGDISPSGIDVDSLVRDWFWQYYETANVSSFELGDPPDFNSDPIRNISDWLGGVRAPMSEVIALADEVNLGTGNILVFGSIVVTCTCPNNGPVCGGSDCEYWAGGGGGGGIIGSLGINCEGVCETVEDVSSETPPPEETEGEEDEPPTPEDDDPENAGATDTCEELECENTRTGIDDPDFIDIVDKAYCQKRPVPTILCP